MRAIHKITVLGAALVAFGAIGMGTALADPPSGTVPATTDIVGVGSDTITPLFAGSPTEYTAGSLSYDYNNQSPVPANKLWSWDAVNPTTGAAGDTIVTKSGCAGIARPDGSSAGITALNNNTMDGTTGDYCIDYARSSRGPNSGDTDTFISLAHDAINWSYPKVSGETNPQPASLTLADLVEIYTCKWTNWNQVPGDTNNDPIVPVLPQSGSGTRSTFLGALGISSTTTETCWINGTDPFSTASPAPVIEENTGLSTGNTDVFDHSGNFDWPLGQTKTTADSADDIFPYSIGDWIAQNTTTVKGSGAAGTPGGATVGGKASKIWGQGNMVLLTAETVNDETGVAESPVVNNSFGQPVINFSNWEQQLTRTLYAVVRNSCAGTGACLPTSPAYEKTGLNDLFGTSGWVCTNNTAESDIVSFGFLNLGNNCGDTTAGT
jgi:ABC-type phosphate transport system substrate-binding protein